MLKMTKYIIVLIAALFFSSGVVFADESPTIDQVYSAAQAGRLDDAQKMMAKVLNDHPNSAKAHFVEAELFAKQGQIGRAESELKIAEQLKPDLSFAKPQAVQELKNRIAASHHVSQSSFSSQRVDSGSSFPWGMLLLGIAAIVVITLIMRKLSAPKPGMYPGNYQPGMQNPAGGAMPMQPYGGGMGSMGGGMGSGIMGGLATGAAVGVGMVAGEALAHHFMDGGNSNVANNNVAPAADNWGNSSNNNMGGSDFGLASNSSWDEGSNVADSGADVGGGDWG
jgi:hypothetical protein